MQNKRKWTTLTKPNIKKKLQELCKSQLPYTIVFNNSDFVINLSSYVMNCDEIRILSYGLDYSIPRRQLSFYDLFAPAEIYALGLKETAILPTMNAMNLENN